MNETAKLIKKNVADLKKSKPAKGSVIQFKMFVEAGPIEGYTFVAIYMNDLWYMSGLLDYQRNLCRVKHEDLVRMFANEPDKYRDLAVAIAWEEVEL